MPTCKVCLRRRRQQHFRFQNARLTICGDCIDDLNKTALSAADAASGKARILRAARVRNLIREVESNGPRAHRAARHLSDFQRHLDWLWPRHLVWIRQDATDRSIEAKLLRALHHHLIFDDHQFTELPANWQEVTQRVREESDFTCTCCGRGRTTPYRVVLQVHHIIFRSSSGTNRRQNLVLLCEDCHQAQHEHIFRPFPDVERAPSAPAPAPITSARPLHAPAIPEIPRGSAPVTSTSVRPAAVPPAPAIGATQPLPSLVKPPPVIEAAPLTPVLPRAGPPTPPRSPWRFTARHVGLVILGVTIVALQFLDRPPRNREPLSIEDAAQAEHPALPSQHQPSWQETFDAWQSTHRDFLADPARSQALWDAIYSVEAESGGTLPYFEILARAYERAAAETGWLDAARTCFDVYEC